MPENVDSEKQSRPEQPTEIKRSRYLVWMVGLLLVLAMCSFWLISHFNTRNLMIQQADSLGSLLAEQTAAQLTELVLINDLVSMNVVLNGLTETPGIAAVRVLNVDREVVASSRGSRQPPRLLISLPVTLMPMENEYLAPVELTDALVGYVVVSLDLSYIEAAAINKLLLIVAVTLLLVFIAVLLTSTWLQATVTYPARLLAYALANIRQGRIETCPEARREDELGHAIRQYNATAEFLAQNTFLDNFGNRLPRESQRDSAARLGQQDVTLLCVRMANFHYLASTLSEGQLTQMLNKFYFFIGKISQLYGARVAYCSEEEVIVNFADLPLEEEQAFYAVCGGQLFQHLVSDIGDTGEDRIPVKFSVAAHSGPAVTGLFSPITNSDDNLTGQTLDEVRLLCEACPDNSLLISAACLEQAGAETRVIAERFGRVGDGEGFEAWQVLEPISEYEMLLERQAIQLVTLYSD